MSKNLKETYEALYQRFYRVVESNIKKFYKNARDKQYAYDNIKAMLVMAPAFNSLGERKNIVELFTHLYKLGFDMNEILSIIQKQFPDEVSGLKMSRGNKWNNVITYTASELKTLSHVNVEEDKKRLLRFLVRDSVYKELDNRLEEILGHKEPKAEKSKTLSYPIGWTASKDNKNEFVQLIYGLHQTGLINKGEGEITKIVEALAEVFQIELGKNWQSNHSASIHKAKNNYQPPVFDRIKNAYLEYSEGLIEQKKRAN